ncbi:MULTISPECIES: DNA cytosine methyltransferase [Pantoea]|uniref:DNA cytosine methyltransferase n=1 Tax=Pantoea TaxID=53335 RepID=UPI001B30E607|nr:DNA cytosine methyltransferase [Pantoea eucrina]
MNEIQSKKKQKILAIDLFAGAGGFSLAAIESGISVISAIELDLSACETYKHNLITSRKNKIDLINSDITTVCIDSLMKKHNLLPKQMDIIIGGPPCQGFSSHRIKNSGVKDPRNNLLIKYFDFVNKLKPKLFLVENVPGLLWDRHKDYLDAFIEMAVNSGYKVDRPIKLNAKDYGVPQNRQRVFILGVREDLKLPDDHWPPKPTHFRNKHPFYLNASEVFEKPELEILKKIESVIGVREASELKFGEDLTSEDDCNIHMNHSENMLARFKLTPINGSREDISFRLPCHENEYSGHKDVYGRIRLAQPGPTITTGCFNPSKGRFLHPWENHGITIRHAARFQTFPDDYLFRGGITNKGKQVGNAVPVIMGIAMLKSCIKIIRHRDFLNDNQ